MTSCRAARRAVMPAPDRTRPTTVARLPMLVTLARPATPARLAVLAMLAALAGSLLVASAPSASAWGQSPGRYTTKHVIVAVMDGVRYSETFGDPQHRYVPRLWKELVPQGTLYTSYYNRGVTVTRQGHSTIASGTYQVVPNGGPRLTMPTFFDYYREETGAPADRAWAVFGKGPYSFEPYSSFPTYLDRWAPKAEIGVGEGSAEDDRRVLAKILAVMKDSKPDLIFANFGYTDHSAHVSPFEEYARAVANVDDIFVKLWEAVQADPDYRDSTTLIMTNDHGRHDDDHGGYRGHGCGCEGCSHLFLLVLGPDTRKGAVITQPAEEIDVCPTVGELLGFQTPLAEGRVLSESFLECLGLNVKAARTSAAKEAVRVRDLAARDLDRAVAHNAASRFDIERLDPTPDAAVLFDGLARCMTTSSVAPSRLAPAQDTLLAQKIRGWAQETRMCSGAEHIYRALMMLAASRRQPGAAGAYIKESATSVDQATNASLSRVDQAFGVALAARVRLAEVSAQRKAAGSGQFPSPAVEEVVSRLAKPPAAQAAGGQGTAPAVQVHAREDALILYALSDALATSVEAGAGLNQALREACLLRYYAAMQAQTEFGGLWADPIDSLLYLAAASRLDRAGAFQGFRAIQKQQAGKGQDEKAGLSEFVLKMPASAILDWTAPGTRVQGAAKETQLRVRFASTIWERNRYLGFSREMARYLVDESGGVAGDSAVLAAGAFLAR